MCLSTEGAAKPNKQRSDCFVFDEPSKGKQYLALFLFNMYVKKIFCREEGDYESFFRCLFFNVFALYIAMLHFFGEKEAGQQQIEL